MQVIWGAGRRWLLQTVGRLFTGRSGYIRRTAMVLGVINPGCQSFTCFTKNAGRAPARPPDMGLMHQFAFGTFAYSRSFIEIKVVFFSVSFQPTVYPLFFCPP